jgi:IclR family acetate operon transcriptional repressor
MPDKPANLATAIDKALDVCEALAGAQRGLGVSDLVRTLRMPPATVHRLLALLKRRGYVRQDEETGRYGLTLRMLDLSFRLLGRSELRLHAYPVLREYAIRCGLRCFIAIPSAGEVTYVWSTGPDEVAMHTTYGKDMPGHCSVYFEPTQAIRRLSCLRLTRQGSAEGEVLRLGSAGPSGDAQRLLCTCAPVQDYTGREVARVGVFRHGADEQTLTRDHQREARELARLISVRLGYLAAATLSVPA